MSQWCFFHDQSPGPSLNRSGRGTQRTDISLRIVFRTQTLRGLTNPVTIFNTVTSQVPVYRISPLRLVLGLSCYLMCEIHILPGVFEIFETLCSLSLYFPFARPIIGRDPPILYYPRVRSLFSLGSSFGGNKTSLSILLSTRCYHLHNITLLLLNPLLLRFP